MKWTIVLLTILLAACQSMESAKQEVTEPPPERNNEMAGVVIWWAHGTEPFWHFTAKADVVSFQNMGETPQNFPYRVFGTDDTDGTARTFDAKTEASSIHIRMTHQTCVNQMSGAVYPWTAEVTIAGENLLGCAERGKLPE